MGRATLSFSLLAAALVSAALAAPAGAATWIVDGRGFGHGVGMSQCGAYGFGIEGRNASGILRHYYRGTTIGRTAKTRSVRVLLRIDPGDVAFTGATGACGGGVRSDAVYRASLGGRGMISLRSREGRFIRRCGRKLRAEGSGRIRIAGLGPYRGALEVVPTKSSPGSLNVINAVDVNSYVKGVVPGEVPSSWPTATLRAQAIAARTYGLSTGCTDCNGFTLYGDTRSQVYGGIGIETERTNRAVRATRNMVVKHRGGLAQTYYFSTSGGRTESGFLGGPEVPYLRSVGDPYDWHSPLHRWRFRFSSAEINAQLGAYVRGRLRGIRITSRGDSPRVDYARLLGTSGATRVRGDTLQFALGLYDRWMSFRKVRSRAVARGRVASPVARTAALVTGPGAAYPGAGGLAD
jgi:stage II sporulation protein D